MTPATELRNQWLTPAEIARDYSRSERQIRNWCSDGTLRAFGFHIHRTRNGWWIAYPGTSQLHSL